MKLTAQLINLFPQKQGNGLKINIYRKKPLNKSSTNKLCGSYIDIREVNETMPFIGKNITKLQLTLEIQREAMRKTINIKHDSKSLYAYV